MKTDHLFENEFIDVENDVDYDQINQGIAEKDVISEEGFDRKPLGINSKSGLVKISDKPSVKTKNSIITEGTFSRQKSIAPLRNNKPTFGSTYINEKEELGNILYQIMNKMFSAKVVLNRLPNPVTPKKETVEKPILINTITRNKIKTRPTTDERGFIHEGTTYVRLCPKCKKPPVMRQMHSCDECKIDLIYECRKCQKQFNYYKKVLAHLDSKCFVRGYYTCSECDFKTVAPARVKLHMIRRHPSVECNKNTIKWMAVGKTLWHECSLCGKKFGNHEPLNKHIPMCEKAHECVKLKSTEQIKVNKDFQKMIVRFCPECKIDIKVYDTGVSSLRPCQKCRSAMKFKCSKCSKEYNLYSTIQSHTKLCDNSKSKSRKPKDNSGKITYCPRCDQPFVRQKWFKKHLLQCKVMYRKPCGAVAYKHLQVACKKCDEVQNVRDRRKFCGKCKSNLHFQCKTCDRNYGTGYDNWCKHLKTYFNLVKYECNECGLGLISRDAIIMHLKICNKGNYQCNLCNFTTKHKPSLYRHRRFQHPVLKS